MFILYYNFLSCPFEIETHYRYCTVFALFHEQIGENWSKFFWWQTGGYNKVYTLQLQWKSAKYRWMVMDTPRFKWNAVNVDLLSWLCVWTLAINGHWAVCPSVHGDSLHRYLGYDFLKSGIIYTLMSLLELQSEFSLFLLMNVLDRRMYGMRKINIQEVTRFLPSASFWCLCLQAT